jgi:hypothetical protein
MEGISIWWAAPFWTPFAMPSAAERPPRRDGMLGEKMRGARCGARPLSYDDIDALASIKNLTAQDDKSG